MMGHLILGILDLLGFLQHRCPNFRDVASTWVSDDSEEVFNMHLQVKILLLLNIVPPLWFQIQSAYGSSSLAWYTDSMCMKTPPTCMKHTACQFWRGWWCVRHSRGWDQKTCV